MLKELEEPGKERMRHLNHRKEKAPPATDSERKSNMQSNSQTKLHPNPSHAWLVAWRRADRGAGVLVRQSHSGQAPQAQAGSSSQLGRGRAFLSAHLVGLG